MSVHRVRSGRPDVPQPDSSPPRDPAPVDRVVEGVPLSTRRGVRDAAARRTETWIGEAMIHFLT